ncbi:MAG: acetyl-CoA carboxylase biotin carboxylase subunit [Thermoleophilia bacterium]|nr:acetyl-CoA carboxylase biotin carboxylase subunit [Thermoleophilia bacterium]
MFRRILVANRGEIALRVIRACHELDVEAVAVYSTADEDSLHVRAADRAVRIGPPDPGRSYLFIPSIVAAALTSRCEAVHPGYGFLAENADFARACADNDLVFIGPSAESMLQLGDKSLAKQIMAEAGLPTIPGSKGILSSVAEAATLAGDIGYPVMLKASAGGGGRGMRLVADPSQLERSFQAASAEAVAAFDNGGLYLEKVIVNPHHVEVQIIGDGRGEILTLGERDCSIQRRHQKVLEESPSPLLDASTRQRLQDQVRIACAAISYASAGTLEFLADERRDFYFMEMNTRVQVEHPVTEMVTGVDIIREQIQVAAGRPLVGTGSVVPIGHSMEFRINAEDPANGFLPRAGTIRRLVLPGGPGVRIDTHLYEGYTVPTNYDSLLAKLIVWDRDRPSCIARGLRCLQELEIEGLPTTRDLHIDILRHPAFREGRFSTAFLENARNELPTLAKATA